MSKLFLPLFFFYFSFSLYAQQNLEPGYIISNEGVKTNVLINNSDWLDNPKEVQYKLNVDDPTKTADLENVREFGTGEFKFERHRVDIDKSGTKISGLSKVREAEFEEELLFLRVLIEGKANLYFLRNKGSEYYFYKLDEGKVEQLVNKKYNTGDGKIRSNPAYKQQLWENLQCSEINLPLINQTDYRLEPLKDLFVTYNECTNTVFLIYNQSPKKGSFNIGLKAGVNFSSFHLYQEGFYHMRTERSVYFEGNTLLSDSSLESNVRLGLEIEYILPFNHGKWAVFLEPTYIPYKGKKKVFLPSRGPIDPNPVRTGVIADFVTFNYSAIEIPLAIRYYFFLNDQSKIFLNGGAGFNFNLSSAAIEDFGEGRTRDRKDFQLETGQSLSLLFGVGYLHSSGFSLETRYYPVKEISNSEIFRLNHNNSFSIIAGYKFL